MRKSRNQVVLPLDLGIKISESDPVRKVVEICEGLDYTKLQNEYLRKRRQHNPETLFMLIVFGYMCRLYSAREIENACRTDIRFMWILQNESVPDHSTIARFQNERLTPAIEDLFYQLVKKLIEMGEVSYRNVFVDGTKIEANANKYTFVWAKAVENNLRKLTAKAAKDVELVCEKYGLRNNLTLEESIDFLLKQAVLYGVEFVHGSGKRKTALQRDIEKLSAYAQKKQSYLESIGKFHGRNSYSKTDIDATFMRMKEDYMRNGQLKPGYNVQIMVESEYIVGMGIFSNPTDTKTLIPFMERVYARTHRRIQKLIADAGYESEENYSYLECGGQEAYIKTMNYEQRKKRSCKENIYRADMLAYDESTDSYVCPGGKRLLFAHETHSTSSSGYKSTARIYRCESSCTGCPHREKCYSGKYEQRQIKVSKTFERQRNKSLKNITSEEGILLRMNRSIQVEGAFGILKQDFGFRRFLTRGKGKVETQFFLLSFAFNIQKLCNRIEYGRLGQDLFEKMIS